MQVCFPNWPLTGSLFFGDFSKLSVKFVHYERRILESLEEEVTKTISANAVPAEKL